MAGSQFGNNQKFPVKLHRTPAIQHGGDSFIEGYSSDDEVSIHVLMTRTQLYEFELQIELQSLRFARNKGLFLSVRCVVTTFSLCFAPHLIMLHFKLSRPVSI